MAVFWVIVIVAIRLAVCFPRSLLAHILFWRLDPAPERGEPEAGYRLRWARFGFGAFAQAALLFLVGGAALGWDVTLEESLHFVVLWAVVVPLLGVAALAAALWSIGRALWIGRFAHVRTKSSSEDGART